MTDSSLQRVTVNFIPKAAAALDHACETTGDTKTDTLNRSVQLYDWVLNQRAQGNRIVVIDPQGNAERVEFL